MTMYYLASPYSKFPDGNAAWQHACSTAGKLIQAGLNIYSPIAHGHSIALLSGLDPLDSEIWARVNAPFIAAADGLIVLMMTGWEESIGMRAEIKWCARAAMRPGRL